MIQTDNNQMNQMMQQQMLFLQQQAQNQQQNGGGNNNSNNNNQMMNMMQNQPDQGQLVQGQGQGQQGQNGQTQARSHRDYASTGAPGDDSKMHVNLWRGSSMSLEWGPYETMQPGHVFTVWPASRAVGMPANPQNINSEYILRTVGSNNALKQILNKQATSLKMRHCLHFQTRKLCRLGADCHFIHSKLESEDAAVPQNNNQQGGLPAAMGLMQGNGMMMNNQGQQQNFMQNNNQQNFMQNNQMDMINQLNNNPAAQQWMLQQQLQQQLQQNQGQQGQQNFLQAQQQQLLQAQAQQHQGQGQQQH